ncbi:MAG: bifunctional 4-hydroxy-2-oxoglutarate aldolase/2-dehydro-3-deoxy-phosphogluconate aldolase [Planctomycetes bacterium]|nr:bifunctional 4-hydroxy-2-oxoglutarate aldolase/2-dehydro-3-deoxy-phosphogluconate aldolase [Planctomycetota bacterium]
MLTEAFTLRDYRGAQMNIKDTIMILLKDGFILVFNQNKLDIVRTAEALIKAGINNMEVTCRINKPLEKLARLRKELPDFAAGTASLIDWPEMLDVYNKANPQDPLPSVQEVVEAGASYLVSAVNFSGASYKKYAGQLPIIPGCGSATEVVSQFSKGANLCKIFPAKQLGGPAFVKAIDPAIHKTISLVPTGGTNPGNIPEYIDAGILVLGGSFSMIEKATMNKIIDEQDYNLLAKELAIIKQLIDRLRAEKYPDIDFSKASLEQISQVTGRNFNIA